MWLALRHAAAPLAAATLAAATLAAAIAAAAIVRTVPLTVRVTARLRRTAAPAARLA